MDKKEHVISLRKQGYSYSDIQKKYKIPKSTLSYWLKDINLSLSAQKRISKGKYEKSTLKLIERNKEQTQVAADKHKLLTEQGQMEFDSLKNNPLFLCGVSLYWAEGYKKGAAGSKWKVVDFANSDEKMICLMMKFFRKFLHITDNKFRLQLISHPEMNIDNSVLKWSTLTGIPIEQFIKTSAGLPKSSQKKRNKNNLVDGTLHIRIYDVNQFFRVIGWIEGLKKEFKV